MIQNKFLGQLALNLGSQRVCTLSQQLFSLSPFISLVICEAKSKFPNETKDELCMSPTVKYRNGNRGFRSDKRQRLKTSQEIKKATNETNTQAHKYKHVHNSIYIYMILYVDISISKKHMVYISLFSTVFYVYIHPIENIVQIIAKMQKYHTGTSGLKLVPAITFLGSKRDPQNSLKMDVEVLYVSHEKNPALLSIESCLVNRDPYSGSVYYI